MRQERADRLRQSLIKRWAVRTALLLLVLVTVLVLNTARNAMGWQPLVDTPQQRRAVLSSGWRIAQPPGPGPHRAAILLSGCDGVHDNMEWWAARLRAQGRATLILDSHGPRGIDRAQSWRAVCAGQLLTGSERAGDLATALVALSEMPGIDAHDVAILGTSHGAWTAMELMAALARPEPPPGLSAWPAPPADIAAQVGPVILLYPYCGLLSRAGGSAWPMPARGLMLLAQNDSITSPQDCRAMAQGLHGKGAALRVLTLPGTDHGFDQQERSALSPLQFDARSRDRAGMLVDDFLTGFASAPRLGI
jgi:dienelactone hydrolase